MYSDPPHTAFGMPIRLPRASVAIYKGRQSRLSPLVAGAGGSHGHPTRTGQSGRRLSLVPCGRADAAADSAFHPHGRGQSQPAWQGPRHYALTRHAFPALYAPHPPCVFIALCPQICLSNRPCPVVNHKSNLGAKSPHETKLGEGFCSRYGRIDGWSLTSPAAPTRCACLLPMTSTIARAD